MHAGMCSHFPSGMDAGSDLRMIASLLFLSLTQREITLSPLDRIIVVIPAVHSLMAWVCSKNKVSEFSQPIERFHVSI